MNTDANVIRISAVNPATLDAELSDVKMIGMEAETRKLGAKHANGITEFYPAEGQDASYADVAVESLAITDLSGSGAQNLGVDNAGNVVFLDFPEGNVIEISTDTNAVSDAIYLVDTTAGAVTVTLPSILEMGFNVRVYKITDINTPEVVIDGNGNLIGTDATQEIVGESEGVSIISDGKYFIVQDNRGGLQRKLSQSTGILSGFAVSTNVDGVSIDIGAGIYVIEDATDMLNPISKTLQYDGVVGYPISNLATEGISFVFIDVDGNLVQQSNVTTTPEQWRTLGRFATVTHFFGTGAIEGTFAYNTPPQNPSSRISTYMNTIGIIREGIVISGASANNLQLANTSGELVSPGSNQVANSLNPDNVTISAQDPVPAIIYLTQNDVDRMDTVVDVLNYDVAGVITLIAGNSTTSVIHRVYMGIDGTLAVQYGQNTYSTLVLAQSALFNGSDDFVQNPILNKITTLLGYVIATKGATNLNSQTDALFFVTDKFGGGGSISQGGAGTSTLQEGYNNSIANPEVLTNNTRLALDIRNGSSLDSNSVLTVQNIAGANVLDVTGEQVNFGGDAVHADGTNTTTVASTSINLDVDTDRVLLNAEGISKNLGSGGGPLAVPLKISNAVAGAGANGDINITTADGNVNIDNAVSTNDATEIAALGVKAFQTEESARSNVAFNLTASTNVTMGDQTSLLASTNEVKLGRFFTTTASIGPAVSVLTIPSAYWPTNTTEYGFCIGADGLFYGLDIDNAGIVKPAQNTTLIAQLYRMVVQYYI